MKKLISIILLITVITTVFVGCNQKKDRILYSETNLSKYVDLCEYKGIKVDTKSDEFKKVYDEVISSDVENYELYVHKTEGVIENGDLANIDYVGKKDGVAFDGGTAEGYNLEIGSGSFIEGFEEGLIGVQIGETVDLNLTFPENYGNAELAGADVVFTVTVNYVVTDDARKPEDFYKELDFDSAAAYTEDVTKRAIKNYLFQKIVEGSKIKDYPKNDLEDITGYLKTSMENAIKRQYGIDLKTYISYLGKTEEEFETDMINEQIKPLMDYQMILYLILDNEKMTVTSKEVDSELSNAVKETGNVNVSTEDLVNYYGRYYFEETVVNNKVLQLIYDNAKIS